MRQRPGDALADSGSFEPRDLDLTSTDPLDYPGYRDVVAGGNESVLAGPATIGGVKIELADFDFTFIGGSLGEVAGERLARALERASERGVSFVLRTASGGARIQEGMRALVQMPRVLAARASLAAAHQPLVAVLGNPTTGGVLASLAASADAVAAVSGATIGFAGPRVVKHVTGVPPKRSHTAASAFESGLVDAVIGEQETRAWVQRVLEVLGPDDPTPVSEPSLARAADTGADAWSAFRTVRSAGHLSALDLLGGAADSLVVLSGDRSGIEDPGVLAALARFAGRRVLVLALDRARAPGPAAYRKACRAVAIAARLDLPVVTLIDTPGADVSERSERGGIAWAVSETMNSLLSHPTPVVSVVTGEGGSGGALALAVGDVLLAFASTVFSVIAPDAAAEILWRDPGRAPEAARLLHLTADELVARGIADAVIDGPVDSGALVSAVAYHLDGSVRLTSEQRVRRRLERWRNRGP
jgi:acetyl-CoA carboxylase alpha subunit/acetyl-CoA carboxylase beta subunit